MRHTDHAAPPRVKSRTGTGPVTLLFTLSCKETFLSTFITSIFYIISYSLLCHDLASPLSSTHCIQMTFRAFAGPLRRHVVVERTCEVSVARLTEIDRVQERAV